MKDLVLSLGEKFLNIIAIICLVGVVLGGIMQMGAIGFIGGLITIIVGVIGVVLAFFFIYLLIDIRDGIRALNKSGTAVKGTD